jgi:hypothetical protein
MTVKSSAVEKSVFTDVAPHYSEILILHLGTMIWRVTDKGMKRKKCNSKIKGPGNMKYTDI